MAKQPFLMCSQSIFLCLFCWFFMPLYRKIGAYSFWPVRLFFCLSVCLSVCKNFNIGHIFWMVSDRALIFDMCVLYDKTLLLVPKFVTLNLDPLFKNFNIGHIFWMASDRAYIFYMCVSYDKTFLLVPNCLTLWPWSLTHFSKTLTLTIHFKW
jgi:hypothetical protein